MGGIGTAICQRLHKEGFKVIAGCGPTRDAQKWLDEQKAGLHLLRQRRQRGDWESTVDAFTKAKAEHGPIDVLVNNAGITRDRMFLKMTREDWDAVIDTNLNSMFNVTKQVVPDMVERGWGRIIKISSVNGQKGQAGQTNYSAAKAGMHGFTMALAQDGQQGRDRQHRQPGLHRHRHGQGHPPRRAREDRRHHPGQAPGRARGDRLHRRLAGRRGLGLHHRRQLRLQRRPAHG
jgi:NAD(P)-dependent dehydrogenase (short-subunit alcohol dehydrogenase family)